MSSQSDVRASSVGSRLAPIGIGLTLLAVYYLYMLIRIDPALVHYQQCPVFLTTSEFFWGLLARPGGIAEYLSLFLSQSNRSPWLGSLVITTSAALLCLETDRLLAAACSRRPTPWLATVPAVMMLLAYGRYNFRFTACVALLTALAFANAYVRVRWKQWPARLILFLILSLVVFWLTAGGYTLLFAILCGLFESVRRRHHSLGAIFVLFGAAIPVAAVLLRFDVSFARSFVLWMPYRGGVLPSFEALRYPPAWLLLAMLVYVPFVFVLAWQWDRLLRIAGPIARHKPTFRIVSPRFLVVVVTAGVVSFSFDHGVRCWLRIGQAGEDGNWPAVLSAANALDDELYDELVREEVVRALYQTGRLSHDLFKYPQQADTGASQARMHDRIASIWVPYRTSIGRQMALLADSWLELGQANRAHLMLQAACELDGPQPQLLQRLAKVNLLCGRPSASRAYLCALRQHLLFRNWADHYLANLAEDPTAARDPDLQEIRPLMPNRDYIFVSNDVGGPLRERDLIQELASSSLNRLAFELLMTDSLLQTDLKAFAGNLRLLKKYGFQRIPQPYTEALLILAASTQDTTLIEGYKDSLDQMSLGRYFNFTQALQECRSEGLSRKKAMARLHPAYGDSYYFFNVFGYTVRETDVRTIPSKNKAWK